MRTRTDNTDDDDDDDTTEEEDAAMNWTLSLVDFFGESFAR